MSSNIKLRDLPDLFVLSKFSRRIGQSNLLTHTFVRLSLVSAENNDGFFSARGNKSRKNEMPSQVIVEDTLVKKKEIYKYFGGIFHKVISSIVGV